MPVFISTPTKVQRMRTTETLEEDLKLLTEEVEDLFFFSAEENHVQLANKIEEKIKAICEAARNGEYF